MAAIVSFDSFISPIVSLSAELIAAYRAAEYVVFANPDLVLRVGAPAPPGLDALLEGHGAASAAFITAANPRGVQRGAAENQAAMAALQACLAWPFHAGEGRAPQRGWPAEPSVLVVGIPRAQAEALGRRFAQNAIVFAQKGAVVELVLLEKMRLVLDTQVWIDWLVFDDPATLALRAALAEGHAEIFIDAPCEAELARVLGYPLGRRTLDALAQAACLSQCRRIATKAQRKPLQKLPPKLPRCRDPDDQKFLELAAAVEADYLVTRDQALLELDRRKLAFRILPPGRF
jgi:uncharacterized protein